MAAPSAGAFCIAFILCPKPRDNNAVSKAYRDSHGTQPSLFEYETFQAFSTDDLLTREDTKSVLRLSSIVLRFSSEKSCSHLKNLIYKFMIALLYLKRIKMKTSAALRHLQVTLGPWNCFSVMQQWF